MLIFTVLYNKIDLFNEEQKLLKINDVECIYLSVKKPKRIGSIKTASKN